MEKFAGKTLLKVVSIITIIGAALGILISFIGLTSLSAVASIMESSNSITLAIILSLAASVLQLVAGIMGIVNCTKPHKVVSCIVIGFICLVLSILGQVLTFVGYSNLGLNMAMSSLLSGILSLVLPILYIIGAFRVRSNLIYKEED